MGAPVAVAAALANTRTGRRIVIGILLFLALVAGDSADPAHRDSVRGRG